MSEQKHWCEDGTARARFWATATELGFDHDAVHEVFNCTSIKDVDKTEAEMTARLREVKTEREKAEQAALDEELVRAMEAMPEAPALAWTKVQAGPGRPVWSISLRAGLPAELADHALRTLLRQIGNVEKFLEVNSWAAVYDGRDQMAIKPPSTPLETEPTAPTLPPVSIPVAQEPQSEGEGTEQIDSIKVTAPSGKPVIEFWRTGRKWPELKWSLDAEAFFSQVRGADKLAELGFTPAHFSTVGKEWPIALNVAWVTSPKNDKWKDIVAVTIR